MSDDNLKRDTEIDLKSEVITIEEDEVQPNKIDSDVKDLQLTASQVDRLCFESSLPEEKSECCG
jgi:hypothetical protein